MATGSVSSSLLPALPVLLLLKQFFGQAVSDHHPPNSTASTTTTAQDPCRFVCQDASCLPSLVLVCDGHSHCSDGGDEVDCPSLLLLHLGTAPKPPSHPHLQPSSNSASVVVHRGTTVAATHPHQHHHPHDNSHPSAVQIVIIIISALFVVGIVTCILSHHTMGARSWSDQRNRPPQPHTARMQLQTPCPQQPPQQPPYTYTLTATSTSIMYSPAAVQERQRLEAGAFHDRLVQLQSVQTDLVMDLPHSIALPDGEEPQHCSATKHLKTQEPHHHGEITRSFIRPPPNRTVYEVDSLPPFRSNSVGLLQKPASAILAQTTIDGNVPHLVMRSHSMSSNSGSSSVRPGHLLPQKGCLDGTSFVPTQLWIPQQVISHHHHHHCPTTNSSDLSGACSNSNRTYPSSNTVLVDSKYTSVDLPPPYDDVANNQWDKNTVDKQNNGV